MVKRVLLDSDRIVDPNTGKPSKQLLDLLVVLTQTNNENVQRAAIATLQQGVNSIKERYCPAKPAKKAKNVQAPKSKKPPETDHQSLSDDDSDSGSEPGAASWLGLCEKANERKKSH